MIKSKYENSLYSKEFKFINTRFIGSNSRAKLIIIRIYVHN